MVGRDTGRLSPATQMVVTFPGKLRHECPTEAKSGKSPLSVVRHKRADSSKALAFLRRVHGWLPAHHTAGCVRATASRPSAGCRARTCPPVKALLS